MAFYELTYIIRPDVPTTQVDAVLGRVNDMVKKNRGKVVKTEQWGLRTLAYPINKHKRGYYTYLGLNLTGEGVADIEHQLKLSDDIIRFMTVKVEEIGKEPTAVMKAKNRMGDDEGGFGGGSGGFDRGDRAERGERSERPAERS